ncbi:DUF1015 family protein, partial [Candidatus Bathyarchaeota archaeon]|nr:DUF1015 family protein [Candidatus Bathyarchaeota archaeon]
MIDIKPFRSIRYTEKAGKYENLITQPYDKIDPTLQEGCYRRSEYNYCRLNLPIEEKRYEIAQQRIGKWTAEGVLSKDKASAIYVCRQEFEFSGRTYTRTGMIVALRLYGYEENKVFPHEVTYEGPKIDRVNM